MFHVCSITLIYLYKIYFVQIYIKIHKIRFIHYQFPSFYFYWEKITYVYIVLYQGFIFQILNVCDYQYNVDCKGTATPKPVKPTQLPTQSPQPSSTYAPIKPPIPSKPSTYPPQPPTYQPQPPTYQPQPPTYQPQPQPQPQPPTYAPQPPAYPKPPSYQPQPYPSPSLYSGNPWLNKDKSDPWHQRNLATQLEIDKEIQKQEVSTDSPALDDQPTHDAIETSSLTNPWTLFQEIPSELMRTPCQNGNIYKLNDSCTKMIVCRNNKPEMIECLPGFSYDKASDSCMPFNVAVW